MTHALTLALLDFSKPFVLETDACDMGVGAVLMQGGKPLAYISQALAPKHLGLSIYDKELNVVLIAVEKWRHYLEGNQFVMRTGHESLKFLLQQRLHMQLKFLVPILTVLSLSLRSFCSISPSTSLFSSFFLKKP